MILISPYSRALRNGKKNPKNYPYWKEVIKELQRKDIIQIGIEGEEQLVSDFRKGLSLEQIRKLVKECDFWISVDNFFPHLANHIGKSGVVLWGISDPNIFGYTNNLNIIKDRKYLRKNQYDIWENYTHTDEVFMDANTVSEMVRSFNSMRKL